MAVFASLVSSFLPQPAAAIDGLLTPMSVYIPGMETSRPAKIFELDAAAELYIAIAEPGSKLADCLRYADKYRLKAESFVAMKETNKTHENENHEHGQEDERDTQGGSNTPNIVQEDVERGYICYARSRMMIEDIIYRHPDFKTALTDQEKMALAEVSTRDLFSSVFPLIWAEMGAGSDGACSPLLPLIVFTTCVLSMVYSRARKLHLD